jgi:hypothetical protein
MTLITWTNKEARAAIRVEVIKRELSKGEDFEIGARRGTGIRLAGRTDALYA